MGVTDLNRVVFASNINIGQNGAETDDEFLFKCFFDHPALSELQDINSNALFALGSTGIGKTALLRMVEKNEKNCSSLELREMAMSHIANSDVIQFLQSIDVDLSIFFQALWRHVICIEYIKLIGVVESQDRFKYWAQKLFDTITLSRSRERLEKFFEQNAARFWNTIDENIIEITKGLEESIRPC